MHKIMYRSLIIIKKRFVTILNIYLIAMHILECFTQNAPESMHPWIYEISILLDTFVYGNKMAFGKLNNLVK